jgi:hypothetical protein
VECDGDRWHTLENAEEDATRQMVLERMGWRFVRIRGGEYFRHPEKALEPLWRRLEELGIHPITMNGSPSTEDGIAKEILALAETFKQPSPPESGVRTPPEPSPAGGEEPIRSQKPEQPSLAGLVIPTKLEDRHRVPPPRMTSEASFLEDRLRRALSFNLPEEHLRPPAKQVLEWLRDNPEWHGRAEILAGSGVPIEDWQDAIRQLLNFKYVVASGNRRLTQYRAS